MRGVLLASLMTASVVVFAGTLDDTHVLRSKEERTIPTSPPVWRAVAAAGCYSDSLALLEGAAMGSPHFRGGLMYVRARCNPYGIGYKP